MVDPFLRWNYSLTDRSAYREEAEGGIPGHRHRGEGHAPRGTINHPNAYNAFTSTTLTELTHVSEMIGADTEIGAIVVTGVGGPLENRGADDQIKALYASMRDCLNPTIARMNAFAIGGGHHLAYICDFTIAAHHAVFSQNGPRGASPAQGWHVAYLVRVVGAKRAWEIWMWSRHYSARQTLESGLANAVVPMPELAEEMDRWCGEMLALSPTILKFLKRSFDHEYDALRTAQDQEDFLGQINPDFFDSGEQAEGASAFFATASPASLRGADMISFKLSDEVPGQFGDSFAVFARRQLPLGCRDLAHLGPLLPWEAPRPCRSGDSAIGGHQKLDYTADDPILLRIPLDMLADGDVNAAADSVRTGWRARSQRLGRTDPLRWLPRVVGGSAVGSPGRTRPVGGIRHRLGAVFHLAGLVR